MARPVVWLAIFVLALVPRLCHLRVVWVEEGYPLAAAAEMLHGRLLYRDLWFDKPPLFPALYLLAGAQPGWPLRLLGAAFVLAAAWSAARAARAFGGGRGEELWAAGLTAICFTFYVHSAVLALTPDLLAVPLHFAAVAAAASGSPLVAGLLCGIAFALNVKALFFLAACALWQWRAWPRLLAGFLAPVLPGALWLAAAGALKDYWQQVWVWGAAYAGTPLAGTPWLEFARRTLNWAGFHAAIAGAGLYAVWKQRDVRRGLWLLISLAAVAVGLRFFPRYYFHLVPPLVLLAARGFTLLPARRAVLLALLLLIPAARFGPRYLAVARGEPWADLAMFDSSRQAAAWLGVQARAGDTLLVWGYRPELFPLTGLRAGTRYLDSQPLTGVLADRHLISAEPAFPRWAEQNRRELLRGPRPAWIADGLGPYNPRLDARNFLGPWMPGYRLDAVLPGYRIYRRTGPAQ
ncbi:MAG: hypothetical protein KatS3mg004_2320 [Bryobacteraceae bacterium]|nr:MAG: hypothetical protein KatS3mg004_2320 [Bryobacteraceae bacterium]